MTHSVSITWASAPSSQQNLGKVTLHSEKSISLQPRGKTNTTKSTTDSLSAPFHQATRCFAAEGGVIRPLKCGCFLSALTKQRQMQNKSIAALFPPVSGRQVQAQGSFAKWIQMWPICKFPGSSPEKAYHCQKCALWNITECLLCLQQWFRFVQFLERKDQEDIREILKVMVFKWKRQR